MIFTNNQILALYSLYPTITHVIDSTAYDANGNEVTYDLQAVTAQTQKDEADALAAEQAQATAKASALAKLTALGLTQDEVKALIG